MPCRIKFALRICLLSAGLAAASMTCFSQLNSTASTVALSATLNETLTVSASPGTVNFSLVPGATANGSAIVALTTTWILSSGRSNVVLVGFFTSASAALTNGSVNIPSSAIYGTVPTGTPVVPTAFTQASVVGTAGASLVMFTQALTSLNYASTRTDNLALLINLVALPQLPAATYTGTLNLEAQAL